MKIIGRKDLGNLYRPKRDSHKGENGRLLVIGGSKLFHAALAWPAEIASKIVDLVHVTSPAEENNDLLRIRIKSKFWNGIVIDWKEVEDYIKEDDCVLIGTGMVRGKETGLVVNSLLRKYKDKKWVIDGGALQELNVGIVPKQAILTPQRKEFEKLKLKINKKEPGINLDEIDMADQVKLVAKKLGCVVLMKGVEDIICGGKNCEVDFYKPEECVKVVGGNWGMTKGGTGDVLAGVAASLYCKNDSRLSAAAASFVNKKAGDNLKQKTGICFNASDLVKETGKVLGELLSVN